MQGRPRNKQFESIGSEGCQLPPIHRSNAEASENAARALTRKRGHPRIRQAADSDDQKFSRVQKLKVPEVKRRRTPKRSEYQRIEPRSNAMFSVFLALLALCVPVLIVEP